MYIGILFGIIGLMFLGLFGYEVLVASEPSLLTIVVSLVFLLSYNVVWFSETLQETAAVLKGDDVRIKLTFIGVLMATLVGLLSSYVLPIFIPMNIGSFVVFGLVLLTFMICQFLTNAHRNRTRKR